jgi:hypothetical protein
VPFGAANVRNDGDTESRAQNAIRPVLQPGHAAAHRSTHAKPADLHEAHILLAKAQDAPFQFGPAHTQPLFVRAPLVSLSIPASLTPLAFALASPELTRSTIIALGLLRLSQSFPIEPEAAIGLIVNAIASAKC